MYKNGNESEYFSELFICKLGEKLGLNMAHYEMDGDYIRSMDFTDSAAVNFEPIRSLMDDDEDYENCFNAIYDLSPEFAKQYLLLIWMDSVCYNMDRHTENFGFIRNINTGEIISLAPNYDNNIALIAKGYPTDKTRQNDGLIRFLSEFIKNSETAREMYREMDLPEITKEIINECLDEIPFEANRDFIVSFILNGQTEIEKTINQSEDFSEDDDFTEGFML